MLPVSDVYVTSILTYDLNQLLVCTSYVPRMLLVSAAYVPSIFLVHLNEEHTRYIPGTY